jgi:hypothetical protein
MVEQAGRRVWAVLVAAVLLVSVLLVAVLVANPASTPRRVDAPALVSTVDVAPEPVARAAR